MQKHFDEQISFYGQQVIINLVSIYIHMYVSFCIIVCVNFV